MQNHSPRSTSFPYTTLFRSTSRELDVATVWVTALQPERSAEVVKALKALAKEFRHQLAHGMRMRRVPELRFKYDESVDKRSVEHTSELQSHVNLVCRLLLEK